MYQAFYFIAAGCLAALLIFANLQSPPVSPMLAGGALVGLSIVSAALGRTLQLLSDIRDRLPTEG